MDINILIAFWNPVSYAQNILYETYWILHQQHSELVSQQGKKITGLCVIVMIIQKNECV